MIYDVCIFLTPATAETVSTEVPAMLATSASKFAAVLVSSEITSMSVSSEITSMSVSPEITSVTVSPEIATSESIPTKVTTSMVVPLGSFFLVVIIVVIFDFVSYVISGVTVIGIGVFLPVLLILPLVFILSHGLTNKVRIDQ